MAEPQPLFDYTGYLPECPTWSEAEQALYWADIMECEIHRYDIRSGEHQVLQFPEEVGCFAPAREGRVYRGIAQRHLADRRPRPAAAESLR